MRIKAEDYSERTVDADGWQVHLMTHKLGEIYHCTADNVSPGSWLARTSGATRAEAEEKALQRARHLLGRTRVRKI